MRTLRVSLAFVVGFFAAIPQAQARPRLWWVAAGTGGTPEIRLDGTSYPRTNLLGAGGGFLLEHGTKTTRLEYGLIASEFGYHTDFNATAGSADSDHFVWRLNVPMTAKLQLGKALHFQLGGAYSAWLGQVRDYDPSGAKTYSSLASQGLKDGTWSALVGLGFARPIRGKGQCRVDFRYMHALSEQLTSDYRAAHSDSSLFAHEFSVLIGVGF